MLKLSLSTSLLGVVALGVTTARAQQVIEGFEVALPAAGWSHQNRSSPVGPTPWNRYVQDAILAHGGTHYAMSDYLAAANGGTISDWLITPEVTIVNGVTLRFWTRSAGGGTFADRMQVRMSTAGASIDVGTTAASVGDFTTLLLDINDTLSPTGYPAAYTEYVITVAGVATPTKGRFAFRYFVTNAGTNGAAVILDDVEISSLCGNNTLDSGEACDDGNSTNGDGCDNNCTQSACGNGIAAGTEGCDDGNTTSGDGCDANCTATACGNGIVTGDEACDDGNATNGDGCESDCTASAVAVCGNGVIDAAEECDAGSDPQEGCTPDCLIEMGFACSGAPSLCRKACGNGYETCTAEPRSGCSVAVTVTTRATGSVLVMLGLVGIDLLRRSRRRRSRLSATPPIG